MKNQFSLFSTRRFLPLFITQFGGALNDNIVKAAVSVLIAYGMIDIGTMTPEVLVSLATSAFIIPFVICAPFAGYLADKMDKARMIRILKVSELLIVLFALAGLAMNNIVFLIAGLVLLGVQSAFFSPCKFSILPHHLQDDELIGGNGILNTGTYLAILSGTVCGSLVIAMAGGVIITGFLLVVIACLGLAASYAIPPAPPKISATPIKTPIKTIVREVGAVLRHRENGLLKTLVGSGWFFFMAAMVMAQMPNVTGRVLFVNQGVLAMFMITFAAGVSLGGLANNQLLKSKISLKFVWISAALSAVFAFDLFRAMNGFVPQDVRTAETIGHFVTRLAGVHILIDLFILAFLGGLYIVPIKAFIQHAAPPHIRGKIMAVNAMVDALFIIVSSLLAAVLLAQGVTIVQLFLIIAAGNAVMAFYMRRS